jgi:hypothetical protein
MWYPQNSHSCCRLLPLAAAAFSPLTAPAVAAALSDGGELPLNKLGS